MISGQLIMSRVIFVVFSLYCFQMSNGRSVDELSLHGHKIMADLENIHYELSLYQINYPKDLKYKLSAIKNDTEHEINELIGNALGNVKILLDEAKEKGEDPIYCHNAANAKMKEISTNGFINLELCSQMSFEELNPLLANIDSTISLTNEAIQNLERLLLDCPETDKPKLESCVQRQINDINVAVANVINATLTIADISKFIMVRATRNSKTCNEELAEKVHRDARKVTEMTHQCIEARESENLKIS